MTLSSFFWSVEREANASLLVKKSTSFPCLDALSISSESLPSSLQVYAAYCGGEEGGSRTLFQVGKKCQCTHSLSGVRYCSISCNLNSALLLIKNDRRAIRSTSSFQAAMTRGISYVQINSYSSCYLSSD